MNQNLKYKKIIITGHTGLKGSWLTAILISYGAKVIGISDNTIKNSHLNYLKIKNKIKDLRVDIRNEKKSILFLKDKTRLRFSFSCTVFSSKIYILSKSYMDNQCNWNF